MPRELGDVWPVEGVTDVDVTTLPPVPSRDHPQGGGFLDRGGGFAGHKRYAVSVTGMSTTLIGDPSIALTSYTRIVPRWVSPTWYWTSVE